MENEFINDIICNVLANECSKQIIDSVLSEFLPNYEKLNLDYTSPPNDENYEFKSENEMVEFFIINKGFNQTFYWNKFIDNPDNIMVGANITSDDELIISLTFDGTLETGKKYYKKLKNFLASEIGIISYINPPEYENGNDFHNKYQQIKYDFE